MFVWMAKGNNIVFSAIFLLLSLRGISAAAHPFYVSVTEVRIDTRKSELTVSCRMFADDLEDALRRLNGRPFDLFASLKDPTTGGFVDKYVQGRVSVGIGGSLQKLEFLGMEQEDEALWGYWQSANFSGLGSITVTDALLYDFLPDQVNVIHVYVNGERKSTRLVNPEKTAAFRFE